MNRKKSVKYLMLIISLTTLIIFFLKLKKIYKGILLLIYTFNGVFDGEQVIINIREIDFLQATFFAILFILFSLFILSHYLKIFNSDFIKKLLLKFSSQSDEFIWGAGFLYFIIMISLTTPILSPYDPNFNKDVIITKLLPPLSRVHYLKIKSHSQNLDSYSTLRKKLFENSVEDNRIYFSRIELNDSNVIVHKNFTVFTLSKDSLLLIDGKPEIGNKLFLLGTDEFGRDLLSRIIYGLRVSFFIGIFSVIISFVVGSLVGYIAGINGGLIDSVLMRSVEFFLSFPILFFVIFLIAFIGNSIPLLILVFGFSGWMYIAKIARNETLACMKKEFIQTLFLAGQTKTKIILKHILPNTFSPILITLIFQMSNVIIAESALSFLGLGVQPPTPTLGGIIKSGYEYLSISWWVTFISGLFLIFLILGINLFAEGMKKIQMSK